MFNELDPVSQKNAPTLASCSFDTTLYDSFEQRYSQKTILTVWPRPWVSQVILNLIDRPMNYVQLLHKISKKW